MQCSRKKAKKILSRLDKSCSSVEVKHILNKIELVNEKKEYSNSTVVNRNMTSACTGGEFQVNSGETIAGIPYKQNNN